MAALVYLLTALAALIVLLTRLRSGRLRSGRLRSGRASDLGDPAFWHTLCGVLGLVLWTTFLVAPPTSVLGGAEMGVFGLGAWWLVVIVGLLLL
ncbi:MAG TPA: hypothetical protein VFR99_11155, partial [Marmoricola sp.]|nr:hypothetical protein [Marmoricola sp.]